MHHWKNLLLLVMWVAIVWGLWYAGWRWNASDEEWMHRRHDCLHTHDFCDPPGPKTW